ncbi:MAG TPA: FAD-binding oxidoreductase [Mesorhizobium sp.]|nr:FAD-binding oxidoreductase [Mesorhizobium sp.]
MSRHVIVVGAGIVGSSIAWHLGRAGARVTVLDAARPGGLATAASWGWVNASAGNPEPYFRLRMRSMAMWRELAKLLPRLRPAWTGGLLWGMPADELESFAREHASWGYPIERLNRQAVAALEPELLEPPELALHVAIEGAVEPLDGAAAFLLAAATLGAEVVPDRPALSLRLEAGAVTGVETAAGPLDADEVVVAVGLGTPALLATIGVALPLETPPGLLVVSKPAPRLLNGLVMAPRIHMRQRADGCLTAGADFGGSDPGSDPGKEAAATFRAMQGLLRSGASLEFSHFTVGERPTPADGFPAIGRAQGIAGLYVAVTHSGVTLAPAIGQMAAQELLEGRRDPLLAPYGLERFAPRGA